MVAPIFSSGTMKSTVPAAIADQVPTSKVKPDRIHEIAADPRRKIRWPGP
jgi:predicted kinase